ncbi:MAG: hypothetical protein LC126_06225 [Bryobacterales bacterium]|nr:hypothetical protein [Bryobacterales bacterium]
MLIRVARNGVLLVAVSAILSPAGIARQVELRNWPTPLYWPPDEGPAGIRGAAISGQLPLVAVTPCRVMDTRPEYAGLDS